MVSITSCGFDVWKLLILVVVRFRARRGVWEDLGKPPGGARQPIREFSADRLEKLGVWCIIDGDDDDGGKDGGGVHHDDFVNGTVAQCSRGLSLAIQSHPEDSLRFLSYGCNDENFPEVFSRIDNKVTPIQSSPARQSLTLNLYQVSEWILKTTRGSWETCPPK